MIQNTITGRSYTYGMFSNTAFLGAGNTTHIGVFSGDAATITTAMKAYYRDTAKPLTNPSNLEVWDASTLATFGLTDTNFLGVFVCNEAVTRTIDSVTGSLTFNLSATGGDLISLKSGTPSVFVLRYSTVASSTVSFASFAASSGANVIMFGTVGDENSEADLKILGGALTQGQHYRMTDLTINF
ncbi:hypothetical protein fHeYen902_304c [Yersinia phage fHe-Yen9-02]|nr:hypothetical protein fHeYen902_304c [Yersinia phage fHe-Yen9-02]